MGGNTVSRQNRYRTGTVLRVISHNFGYGVGDDMDSLLARQRRA